MPSTPLVNIAPVAGSPIACGAVVFRHRSELRVTAIVKATYSMVSGGVAVPAPPTPIVVDERRYNDHPRGSVIAAADTAPYRPRVDVTFVGQAYPPRGASTVAVRLAIFGQRPILDKTVYVYGDRPGRPDGSGRATPGPFDRMPLVYEKAVASLSEGTGVENPVGSAVPNLVDPRNSKSPACFGPIARDWPGRARLLRGADRRAVEASIAEIPHPFDWRYFQTAPRDQQIDALRGDEWIVLEGVHATLPRIQTRLPPARAVAFVNHGGGKVEAMTLVADTLAIDGERFAFDIVWRGSALVPGAEASLASIQISAALTASGDRARAVRRAPSASAKPSARLAGTVIDLRLAAPNPRALDAGAPFVLAAPGNAARPTEIAGAPWSGVAAIAALPVDDDAGGTLVVGIPAELIARLATSAAPTGVSEKTPLAESPNVDRAPAAEPDARPRRMPRATVAISSPTPPAPVAPFPVAPASGAPRAVAEIPGAPWAHSPAPSAPKISGSLATTLPLIETSRARHPSSDAPRVEPAKQPEKRRMYGKPRAKKR